MDSREEQEIRDTALLQQHIGYKQELKRSFSALHSFALCFTITGLVPSIAATIPYALAAGPAGLIWGWVIGLAFVTTVATALAELSSALPTTGALYFWTFYFGPKNHRGLLCYVIGYLNTLGSVVGLMSISYSVALMISSVVGIATNGEWTASRPQVYLIALAVMVSHATVSSLPGKALAAMQTVYMVGNFLIIIVVAILLPALTPSEKRPEAIWVFTHVDNGSDWPTGFTFILAFLMPLWTVNGFESSIHISEETRDAVRAVPKALMWIVVASFVLGLACVVGISFSVKNFEAVRNTPLGQPMAQILLDSFGFSGALAAWTSIAFLTWTMGSSVSIATSRQVWAFSRDGALPFSKIISWVTSRGVPIFAVWCPPIIAALFGLLALINEVAASALFSLGVVASYSCYAIPIFSRLTWGRDRFVPGPFYTGDFWSPIINWTCLICMAFFWIIFLFPTSGPHPTAENMNYGAVIFAAVISGVLISWYLPNVGAKHWFTGPKNDYAMENGLATETIEGSIVHSSLENRRMSSKACEVLGIHYPEKEKQ